MNGWHCPTMNKESTFGTYIEKSSYLSHRKVFLRSRGRRPGKQGGKKSKERLCVSVIQEPRPHRQHRRAAGGAVGRCWDTARWVCPLSQIKTSLVNQTTCQENTRRISSSTRPNKTGRVGGRLWELLSGVYKGNERMCTSGRTFSVTKQNPTQFQ